VRENKLPTRLCLSCSAGGRRRCIARSSAENTKSAADEAPSKVVTLDDGD
jgi:hypothetical protein